jgi:RNA polymerase-binding transcription factor DksA
MSNPAKNTILSPGQTTGGGDQPVDPRWAWQHRVLLDLRDRLLDGSSEQLQEAAEPLEPHSLDLADSATDEFDHDLALSELSAEQDALLEVNEALDRLARGAYGICQETGLPIPEERLKAIPWARCIRTVQSRIDSMEAAARPHLGKLGSVRPQVTGNIEDSDVHSGDDLPMPEANDELLTPETLPIEPGSGKAK